MIIEYYTVEELRELGCPDGLIIQYYFLSKETINKMINFTEIERLVEEME